MVAVHDLSLDGSVSFLLLFPKFFHQSTFEYSHAAALCGIFILLSDPLFQIPVIPREFCLPFF